VVDVAEFNLAMAEADESHRIGWVGHLGDENSAKRQRRSCGERFGAPSPARSTGS
jgi:hypothetical protein